MNYLLIIPTLVIKVCGTAGFQYRFNCSPSWYQHYNYSNYRKPFCYWMKTFHFEVFFFLSFHSHSFCHNWRLSLKRIDRNNVGFMRHIQFVTFIKSKLVTSQHKKLNAHFWLKHTPIYQSYYIHRIGSSKSMTAQCSFSLHK